MSPSSEKSLTGSQLGAPSTHSKSVSVALGRLRFSVLLSCWIIGLALLVQTVVWGLTTYTSLRWAEAQAPEAQAALVVKARPAPAIRSALDDVRPEAQDPSEAVDPNRMISGYDRIFGVASRLARGLGTLAVLAMLPLIAVGVLLAASSATIGVDKTVSAFTWSVVVAFLTLPLGDILGLPHQDGAFWSYASLTAEVDAADAAVTAQADSIGRGQIVPIARYLLLPLAALCAVGMLGLRFDAGVEAGLMQKEDLSLDVQLENEAGNIQPGSLHGGRAAAAMDMAVRTPVPFGTGAKPVVIPDESPASIKQARKGDAPKRLI